MFYVVLVVVSVLIYVVYVAYRRILNPVGEAPIDIKRFSRKFGPAAIVSLLSNETMHVHPVFTSIVLYVYQ